MSRIINWSKCNNLASLICRIHVRNFLLHLEFNLYPKFSEQVPWKFETISLTNLSHKQ